KLDNVIQPTGTGLSGGQAQRVSLARSYYSALTENRNIILLDEPTSALDPETEQRVVQGMRSMAQRKFTIVVISHRTVISESADQVIDLSTYVRPESAQSPEVAAS